MFEYVNTSVPNGLLPGTHGFCAVAMTRDLPEPVRRRLESFSSYTHLATANGPDYLRLNPVSWSHLVLDGGEHVLGCVRAAPFDYTGRTNRLARFWFFQAAEVPAGLNPADAILQGGNSASLSDAWSGEPRWLASRAVSPLAGVPPRSDARPAAWMQTFGESDGPRLAAAFSVLLAERIRAKGRPLVFLADPATHSDGSLLLALFADLIALLPAPLRVKATFSTYPVALSSSTACHLRGEFGDATRLLAGETAWIDLRARRVHGAETAAVPPELLFLATHGYEQPPEPVIRGGSRRPAPLAQPASSPAPSRTPRLARGPKPPVGRLISRTAAPKKKKPGFEDYLLWALLVALVVGAVLLVYTFNNLFASSKPMAVQDQVQQNETKTVSPKAEEPKSAPKPKEEKPPVTEPTTPTNEPVQHVEQKPDQKTQPAPPKPAEQNPLLLAKEIKVVKAFDYKKVRLPEQWTWAYYEPGSQVISLHPVETTKLGFKGEPKQIDKALLLLDKQKELLYWKWMPPSASQFFKNADSVDLRQLCFGHDPVVFETWKRVNGMDADSYSITSDWDLLESIEFKGQYLRLAWLAEEARKMLDARKTMAIQQSANLAATQKQLDDIMKEIADLENKFKDTKSKKDHLDGAIAGLQAQEKAANAAGKKSDKEKYEAQRKEKEAERDKLPNLLSISNNLATKQEEKRLAEINVKHAKRAIERLEQLEAVLKDDNQLRTRIRETTFSISLSDGTGT